MDALGGTALLVKLHRYRAIYGASARCGGTGMSRGASKRGAANELEGPVMAENSEETAKQVRRRGRGRPFPLA
jgi:hypothetical protein